MIPRFWFEQLEGWSYQFLKWKVLWEEKSRWTKEGQDLFFRVKLVCSKCVEGSENIFLQ